MVRNQGPTPECPSIWGRPGRRRQTQRGVGAVGAVAVVVDETATVIVFVTVPVPVTVIVTVPAAVTVAVAGTVGCLWCEWWGWRRL